MIIAPIGVGSLVRLQMDMERGDEKHWSFKTTRIARGKRVGTVLGRIDAVCEKGCCIWIRPPEDEHQFLPAMKFQVDELLPTLEEDTHGSTDGGQHTPVEQGPDVQGVRAGDERQEGREALREAVSPRGPFAERTTQGVTYLRQPEERGHEHGSENDEEEARDEEAIDEEEEGQ